MTPSGIEPTTFRFVAQHLNHRATAVPHFMEDSTNLIPLPFVIRMPSVAVCRNILECTSWNTPVHACYWPSLLTYFGFLNLTGHTRSCVRRVLGYAALLLLQMHLLCTNFLYHLINELQIGGFWHLVQNIRCTLVAD